ncbi:MAG: rod shape-determining protein MreD [Lachnospiraceae bacterium]|nr:rod shape-determining protein MreD [Lachnospiraceae bacterium]
MQKTLIKSAIAIVGSTYVCFLLQTGLFSRWMLAGVTPNLILVVTSLSGFMLGAKYGMITGFTGGLLLDTFIGSNFGMFALIYLYIGFLNGSLSKIYFGDDIKLPVFLVGISDFLFGMIVYASMFLLRDRSDIGFYFSNVIMPEAVYSMVIALFFYFPIKRLCQWVEQVDKGR